MAHSLIRVELEIKKSDVFDSCISNMKYHSYIYFDTDHNTEHKEAFSASKQDFFWGQMARRC